MKRMALLLVVLVGALFGYLSAWGQEYGAMLNNTEQQAMAETFQYALEYNRLNEASAWVNPDTGRSGTVVPVRTLPSAGGRYCREFLTTIIVGGAEEQAYGTACREPDGSWVVVSDEMAPESLRVVEKVIERHYYHPYGYRDWYAYHPYYYHPWYHSPRVFFSFNIVHFVGTRRIKAHPFHFHAIQHPGSGKIVRGKPADGIIRSHPGRTERRERVDFRDQRHERRRSVDSTLRSGGPARSDRHFRSHPGGRDLRRGSDERLMRPRSDRSGPRSVEGRRDRRGFSGDRGVQTRGGRGGSREFHQRREFRDRSGFEGSRPARGGQLRQGGRGDGGGRSGRR
ncbi:RT0821/Lpp0805 family surface protein [Geoalkalibacter halelectricus]|uniref:RT0821/Lpp0805 family surface protein n=1 Tax=Geoalkalibacter halelectricus TaxID=2847045 RepID=UPI003D1DA246